MSGLAAVPNEKFWTAVQEQGVRKRARRSINRLLLKVRLQLFLWLCLLVNVCVITVIAVSVISFKAGQELTAVMCCPALDEIKNESNPTGFKSKTSTLSARTTSQSPQKPKVRLQSSGCGWGGVQGEKGWWCLKRSESEADFNANYMVKGSTVLIYYCTWMCSYMYVCTPTLPVGLWVTVRNGDALTYTLLCICSTSENNSVY